MYGGQSTECLDRNCVFYVCVCVCVSLCSSLLNLNCAIFSFCASDVDLNAADAVEELAFRDALLRQDRKFVIHQGSP